MTSGVGRRLQSRRGGRCKACGGVSETWDLDVLFFRVGLGVGCRLRWKLQRYPKLNPKSLNPKPWYAKP